MSEAAEPMAGPQTVSAGTLLRQARMAQGLHIAALAAAIKVSPRKLELLETDRVAELPDAAFARALALRVCRQLKIDAEAIMERLPHPPGPRLEHVSQGLGAPFHDRPGREAPAERSFLTEPVVWGPALIIAAALALYLMPQRLLAPLTQRAPAASAPPLTPEPAASKPAALSPAAPGSTEVAAPVVVETVHSAPVATAQSDTASASGVLVVRTNGESWVEVLDAGGQALLSRVLLPGETVGVDGALPLRVRVGNVAATQLSLRGRPVDLSAAAHDNTARLELK
jgi:cytoskeleton protein RodZ